jgi:hypothetical protein
VICYSAYQEVRQEYTTKNKQTKRKENKQEPKKNKKTQK